ncbi:unnamed protein product [Effrenium voratum]|uniref:Ubiquitin-like domain-containing protein n=1 Tax=Effrenium voratum TaxID=2562239 RepID=A0AA36NDL6_9DINO|nr:unnamed protein product [Effrenium voratum]
MKRENERLLTFITMNDLMPAFEKFRQSQEGKDWRDFHINLSYNYGTETVVVPVEVGLRWSVLMVKVIGWLRWHIPLNHQNLTFNGNRLGDALVVQDINMQEYETLHLTITGIIGGGRPSVQKAFLKKPDAIRALKKKARDLFQMDDEMDTPDQELPEPFRVFLQQMETSMNEFLMMKTRAGSSFLAIALKHINTEELVTLKSILSPSSTTRGKNLTGEEKLSKSIDLLFPSMQTMKKCSSKLEYHQNKTLVCLMDTFIDTYHNYVEGSGSINIDISGMAKVVETELSNRTVSQVPNVVAGSNCSLQ